MEFIRIFDLLEQGTSHGAIASAIEEKGYIFGWDRFGRYRKFINRKKDADCEYAEVLNALAVDYKWFINPRDDEEGTYRDVAFGEFPKLGKYGWPDTEKINFSKYVIAELNNPVQAKVPRKTVDNNLRIIGAMRECLVGVEREAFIEQCKKPSNACLIEFLEHRYQGYPGLHKRNLEEKFGFAKTLLEQP